ncbi:MAG: aldo/keto reductase [Chloroflexi bacterium]|nr:aldo/keto reductase [Chloroflexota bacterium]
MNQLQLGLNGPVISSVCFGAWPIGGGLGSVDKSVAIDTIHSAIAQGITFFDTAEGYKTSETILGEALKGRRSSTVLASKFSGNNHSETHIFSAIDKSLNALQTDYIDLYQIHSPQDKWPIEDTMASLNKLIDQGKIRFIGVSNFSTYQTTQANTHGLIQSSQPRYNMLFRDEGSNIKFCYENGIGVMAHSVLAKGLLTGKYRPGHKFALDDERRFFNFFKGDLFEKVTTILDSLNDWCKARNKTLTELAIAWVLANPNISTAIIGLKTRSHVAQAIQGSNWQLSKDEMNEISLITKPLQIKWVKDIY